MEAASRRIFRKLLCVCPLLECLPGTRDSDWEVEPSNVGDVPVKCRVQSDLLRKSGRRCALTMCKEQDFPSAGSVLFVLTFLPGKESMRSLADLLFLQAVCTSSLVVQMSGDSNGPGTALVRVPW